MTAQLRLLDRGFFDLSTRLKLRVSGSDRLRFLNGQLTNDIRKATDTTALEACVLNAKGKMEAHLFVHAKADSFILDADPALQSTLQARLERYIIADDVQIEDVTAQLSIFHVIAAASESQRFDPHLTPLPGQGEEAAKRQVRVVLANRYGIEGCDLWVEADRHAQVATKLGNQFEFCDENCAEVFRIEQGIPRWGRELTGDIIPIEANLEQRCIDYDKGCYIGQETISRMKMSGQRNKQLCGLISLKNIPLVPGMRLIGPEGKEIGWITSATRSGEQEIALAYVKRGFNSIGTEIEAKSEGVAGVRAEVVDLPFGST